MAKPIVEYKKAYGELIAKELIKKLKEELYIPIFEILNKDLPKQTKVKLNAVDDLMMRLQNGKIFYDGEYFRGSFNAQISKQLKEYGAEWSSSKSAFKISMDKLPPTIKTAVSSSLDNIKDKNKAIDSFLAKQQDDINTLVEKFTIEKSLEVVVGQLERQTISAMDAIGVKYTLTYDQKESLKKAYVENVTPYIKGMAEKHILELRKDVANNALLGYRYEDLKNKLVKRYGVAESRVNFIAHQETSMFMAKFRSERFRGAGVNYYKWQVVPDSKVRQDHMDLNGKIFMFGQPPIVDKTTGKRAEPGEDFGCRCIARPILGKAIDIID